jgi:uncharacterized repeat protein (TIGR01451 family)
MAVEKYVMKVKDGRIGTVAIAFISALVLLTMVASVTALDCDCDLCVNETGWWGAGGAFNASGTPIQAAVDNATAGETICVQNGTYSENVVVNKSLTIRSEYGASSTTVEANDTTLAVFRVINDSVNISGFTIKNATDAQGILCYDADNCTISGNTISNNVAGIHLDKGSVNNLVNNTVLNNIYGIYLDSSSYNNLTGNTATNNNYTGIFLDSSSNNTIMGNIVNSNPGGGIYLDSSSGNNLADNTASNNDNGIWLYNSSYNNLTNNKASGNDDGIKLESWSNNNTLMSNNASNNYVVGIKLESWSNNNTLMSNIANSNVGLGMDGIGIHIFDSNHSNLTGNIANLNGYAGISLDNSYDNNLTGNTVNANGIRGIVLEQSQNNTLLDNFVAGHKWLYGSFDVLLLKGASWTFQGERSFRNYETWELPLTHGPGTVTLRLHQHGHDSAYVDYVALKKGGLLYEPATAVNPDSGADICHKLVAIDYDVCDAWESTLELTWDSVPADTTLVMRAMEEDLGPSHGSPLYHPFLREGRTLSYTLVNDGGIVVDGVLNESKEPSFNVFWRPDTPHPDGYTYGWLHADDQYLYAAVEVTSDNTPDEEDWGALFVMVNSKLREFRVAPAEATWGQIGFQYTSSVSYEHRIYEFAIPLCVLNAHIGDEVRYGFAAYGTGAEQYSGISLRDSDHNTIAHNWVTDNEAGLYLFNASENNITCNAVYKNERMGFYLDYQSENNLIEQNAIVANGEYEPLEVGVWSWEYNFVNTQEVAVNATNNYWGTAVPARIAASIDENPGDVTYEPFLYTWPLCAPDAPVLGVVKTVWDGTAWVAGLVAPQLNDTFRFNCTIMNLGTVNLTQIRFWDILDCSLVFAGNATLKNASGVVINDSIVLEGNYIFKPIVLHPDNLSWDPYHPSDSEGFTELCPDTGHQRALWDWEDTDNDGRISACDQIYLTGVGSLSSYHVDRVPYTLNVTNNVTGESMYLESDLDYELFNLASPYWYYLREVGCTEACCEEHSYYIPDSNHWNDTDHDGNLSVNDLIQFEDDDAWYTITEIAIDLVVSREWDVDAFASEQIVLAPGQSLTLEYNATDIRRGENSNGFFAKGLYEGNWTYSYGAYAWVYCPEFEVTKTVWNGTAWVKELTASINDTVRFNCTITNFHDFNLSEIRFWDILDCSLVFAGNATLTNASGVKEEITIPPCPPSYCFKPHVLHPYNLSWDPYNPELGYGTGENFTELCPDTGHSHRLITWDDTHGYNERISACDQVYLLSAPGPYHVENVPYTLLVNNTGLGESMYIESVLDYESVTLRAPNGTEWLTVCGCKDRYTLLNWTDVSVPDGNLSAGDRIVLKNGAGAEAQYTVEEVTIDLVVSKEWQLDYLPGLYVPRILEPSQSFTIEYNATVVKCGVDNNTFVAVGRSYDEDWIYSLPAVVTVTVPCAPPPNITDPKVAVDIDGPPLLPGDVICYTAWINNTGNGSSADNLGNEFEDPIPDHTTYITASANASSGTIEYNDTNNLLTWNGVIPAHGSIEITFCVSVDLDVPPGTVISNQGTVNYDSNGDGINDAQKLTDDPATPPIGDPTVLITASPAPLQAQVPAVTPLGLIALVSALSAIAAVTITRRKRR